MAKSDSTTNPLMKFIDTQRGRLIGYIRSKIADEGERDAEDIFHDVITTLWGKGEEMNAVDDVSAYVMRSINNRIIDRYRKRARKEITKALSESGDLLDEDESVFVQPGQGDASDDAARVELQNRIDEAVDALPPAERAVWVATELDGRTFKELSVEWDESMNTLLSRKHRANLKLRAALVDMERWLP